MKKAGSILTVTLLSLLTTAPVYASTSVHVSSEGNASAQVNVQSNFNSSNTTTTTNTSNTKIRIETNGEVKEYESTNGEDIDIESSDGSSKVTVKNGSGSNNTIIITPKPFEKDGIKEIEKAKETVKGITDKGKKEKKDLFEIVEDFIKGLISNIF